MMDDTTMTIDDDAVRTGSLNSIKLNVGGKPYEISRSLINQFAESMIGKLVSDTWQRADRNETIFIDRDGDIFGHVLNYMRYGSIELPASLPKSMFQRELDFYGLPNTSAIKQESSIETMKELQQYVKEAELHHDMLLIATSCYHQYMMGKKVVHIVDTELLKHSPFYYHYADAMKVLNYYLRKFHGLEASASRASLYSTDFILDVKQLSRDARDNDDLSCNASSNVLALPATFAFDDMR